MVAVALAARDYVYYGTVEVEDPSETPGGVALKADGDLYYVTFNVADSHFVYVQNAVPGCLNGTYTRQTISTEVLPAGRGLNDIDLDSAGNIYISGTGNDAASTVLKKFSAAPAHTEVWSAIDLRINGIELMNENVLAVSETWNNINWKNTSDGQNTGTQVSGGSNYQRSLALNTLNNDIYVGKDGDFSLAALKIFSGGSPSDLASYALVADNLLSSLGCNTQYGVACQPVDFDPNNNQLIAADIYDQDTSPSRDPYEGVRFYDISGSGSGTSFIEDQFIDGSGIPGKDAYYNIYGVSYAKIGELDYLAVAVKGETTLTFRIDIFYRPPPALAVKYWTGY